MTRQVTIFNSLMQNYGDTLKYVETQQNSAGLASERYAIYLESVEAAQNRLTASWERMWQETIQSGAITWFLDLATAMLDVVGAGGGLMPLFSTILGFFVALKSEQISTMFLSFGKAIMNLVVPLNTVKFSLDSVKVATVSTGMAAQTAFGYIGIAIAGLSMLFMAFQANAKEAQRRVEELSSEISQLYTDIGKQQSDKKQLMDLGSEYTELKKLQEQSSLTTEQMKRFVDVQNEIHDIVPQVSGEYDEQGNFLIENATNLGKLLELKKEEIRINEELLSSKLNEQILTQAEAYRKQKEQYQSLLDMQEGGTRSRYGEGTVSTSTIDEQRLAMDDTLNQIEIGFASLSREQQETQLELLRNSGEFGQELAKQLESLVETQSGMLDRVKDDIVNVRKEYTTLLDDVQSVNDKMSILSDVSQKSQSGKLLPEDLIKLAEAYPNYLEALTIENGQLKLNSETLRQYGLDQIQVAIDTARANNATQEQIDVLEAQRDALLRSIPSTEYFNTLMTSASETMSGESKEVFDNFAQGIGQLNQQFVDGKLSGEQYFSSLQNSLQNTNLNEMFGGNTEGAQAFFTGMVSNAGNSLSILNSQFDSGKISLEEYTEQLTLLGGVFETIGGMTTNFAESLGLSASQVAEIQGAVDSALGSITSGVSELQSMQELNMSVQQAWVEQTAGSLQYGSEAYAQYMNQIANLAGQANQTITDLQGNVISGSDNIRNWLMADAGNFAIMANQTANKTGESIQKVVNGAGQLLATLGSSIKNFKFKLSFNPEVGVGQTVDLIKTSGLLSMLGQAQLTIPSLALNISGDGNDAVANIGQALMDFGNNLATTDFNFDASSLYGSGASPTTNPFQGATSGAGALSNAANDATKSVNNLSDALKKAETNAINSLKAQLKGYKDLIDTRKKLLDSLAEERDYQNQVDSKNQEIVAIQNELATLQFDNSEEAQARRLQLQGDLAELESQLADIQFDYSIDQQKQALDAEYQAFESTIENAINQVQGIQATNLAQFAQKLSVILAGVGSPSVPQFHSGIEEGAVGRNGGFSLKSNEMFAKLLKDEVVLRPDQIDSFMKNTLPQIAKSESNFEKGDISMNMPITVQGNLDKSVLPELESMITKTINKVMMNTGFNRRADLYQT